MLMRWDVLSEAHQTMEDGGINSLSKVSLLLFCAMAFPRTSVRAYENGSGRLKSFVLSRSDC